MGKEEQTQTRRLSERKGERWPALLSVYRENSIMLSGDKVNTAIPNPSLVSLFKIEGFALAYRSRGFESTMAVGCGLTAAGCRRQMINLAFPHRNQSGQSLSLSFFFGWFPFLPNAFRTL